MFKRPRRTRKTEFVARERQHVKQIVKKLKGDYPKWFIKIDTDSPQRQFKSGWDFFITREGAVFFFEAKHVEKLPKDVRKLLRDEQEICMLTMKATRTPYSILVFVGNEAEPFLYNDPVFKNAPGDAVPFWDGLKELGVFDL